jgi:dipeptidyl aminopeptidase/acylaminoacyl peptidase
MRSVARCGVGWLTAIIAAATVCATTRGEEKISIELEDVIRMKTMQNAPVPSPDGNWIAYTVRTRTQSGVMSGDDAVKSGLTPHEVGSDIFVYDRVTGKGRNLTEEKGNSWAPSWSPDSHSLAFVSDRGGESQPRAWVWDLRSDALKKISDASVRIWGVQQIAWSSDSKKIFIPAVPGQLSGEQYFQRVIDAGTSPKQCTVRGSTALVYASPNTPKNLGNRASGNTLGIDERFRDLLMIDLTNGQSTTLVSNQRIGQFYVIAGDFRMVFSSAKGLENEGSQQIQYDLVSLDLPSGKQSVAATAVPLDYFGRFSVSPDSSLISYRTNPDSARVSDVFVVSVNGGEARNLTHFESTVSYGPMAGDWKRNFSVTPLWNRDSEHVYSVTRRQLWESSVRTGTTRRVGVIEGHSIAQVVASLSNVIRTRNGSTSAFVVARDEVTKQEGLFSIDLTSGATTKIVSRGQCYTCEAATDARYIAGAATSLIYIAEDAQHPADLWETDYSSGATSQLTHLNPRFDQYKMGNPQLVDWLDDDGHRLRGALLLPSDYVPGRHYPLIVLVYGGVLLSGTINRFGGYERGMPYFNPQLFSTRGYAFLAPDAPQDFGTPMLDLVKTVLPGINKVIDMGIADPERLGVMGHSYGGYSTLSLLVQTKRFKAAIEVDGMADLVGMYGEMDKDGTVFGTSSETGQQLLGGNPWQVRDRYIENSPIFGFDRIETPLLVIHGGDDRTVAPFLGDEIFVALRRLGKTVSYAKYQGESHVPSSYGNQLDIGRRVIDWFDRYLKDGRGADAKTRDGSRMGQLRMHRGNEASAAADASSVCLLVCDVRAVC